MVDHQDHPDLVRPAFLLEALLEQFKICMEATNDRGWCAVSAKKTARSGYFDCRNLSAIKTEK
jgi:hypothetical protein